MRSQILLIHTFDGFCPQLIKKYGPVFTIWLGTRPLVVLCGYEAVKDALVTHSEEFGGRPSVPILDHVTKGYGLISEDAKWKTLRRFTLSTLRNFGMGTKSMAERISEEAHCLVEKITAFEGQPFDTIPNTTAAVSNVMCSIVFGNRFSYEDKNFIRLLDMLNSFTGFFVTVTGVVYNALPNIMNCLPGPHNKMFSDCNEVCNFVRSEVDSHKKNLDPQNPGDFIDCFLLKLEKEQNSSLICMEDLVMSVVELFLGGTDTTASNISYGLILLARFPHIQAKVQQEIDEIVGANRAPSVEDRVKLSYTNAFVHEIQRFQQSSAETFPRLTTQDVNFRGHFIPQGTIVLPLWVSVHFDPLYWEDPEKFDPGHFLDEKGEFQKRDAFLPFSAGKRSCPGAGLASMELFMFFTTLLQHFTFELIIDPEEIGLEDLFLNCRKNGKHRYLRAIKRKI